MPMISLGKQFSRDLRKLAKALKKWPEDAKKNLHQAHKRIGHRWRAEAVKRVPVDTGTLKQRIVENTYWEGGNSIITECGSNVPYAPFVEFGTRHIAGGRILALGDSPDITDAEAIKDWPAKAAGGVVNNQSGNAAVNAALQRRAARGSASEQMPWLRPAFNSIRDWAIDQLAKATEPPKP